LADGRVLAQFILAEKSAVIANGGPLHTGPSRSDNR
jgi:hypothetical protein